MSKKVYGLLDTKTNSWLGDEKGPTLYSDKKMAQIAARILDVRLSWPAGTIRAREYKQKSMILKDIVVPTLSAEKALDDLETGLRL